MAYALTVIVAIALLVAVGGWLNSVEAQSDGTCNSVVSYTEYYVSYESDRTRVYTVCGIWDCCRCSKWQYRARSMTRSRVRYRTDTHCCHGYTRRNGQCQSICTPACQNGGICVSPHVCTCASGYTGDRCQTPICSLGCANGGRCIAPNTCTCASGWTGHTCQIPICRPACQYGGTCTSPGVCVCASGSTGNRCEIPTCGQFGCENGGNCVAPNTCTCTAGWTGHTCETLIEVDEVFMLGNVTYPSGSTIKWSEIGEGENALMCKTTHTDCCGINANGQRDVGNHRGQFYHCDGTPVPIQNYAGSDGLYKEWGYQKITLNRNSNATVTPPSGWYRCDIPDRNGVSHNIYIKIVEDLPTVTLPPPTSITSELAKFQIIVSGVANCQEWKGNTDSTLVRYKTKLIFESMQELSQVNNITFNDYVDVSLQCNP